MKLKVRLKGGPGSGHHGHRGRPGEVGGSAPRGSTTQLHHGTRTDLFHLQIDLILEEGLRKGKPWHGREPSVYMAESPKLAFLYAADRAANTVLEKGDTLHGVVFEIDVPEDRLIKDTFTPHSVGGGYDLLMGERQSYSISYNIPPSWISKYTVYEVVVTEEFLRANSDNRPSFFTQIEEVTLKEQGKYYAVVYYISNEQMEEKGGPGSGHHGHAGRPGQVGGSAPGKSTKFGTLTSKKHPVSDASKYVVDSKGNFYYVKGRDYSHTELYAMYVLSNPDKFDYYTGVQANGILETETDEHWPFEDKVMDQADIVSVSFDEHDKEHKVMHLKVSPRSPLSTLVNAVKRFQSLVKSGRIDPADFHKFYIIRQRFTFVDPFELEMISGFIEGEHNQERVVYKAVEEKQLPIDDAAKRKLFQVRLEIFYDSSDALAEQVFTGGISIADWETQMRAMVKDIHTSAAAIGKGGWDAMSFQEWGRLGTPLRQQYKWLHGFAQDIAEQMDDISVGTIRSRARMYGRAAGYVASLMQAPKEILSQLPWIPKDGSTECLTNCKCVWLLKVIDKIKAIQTVQATWWMRVAEHCNDCPERNGHIETFDIDAKVQVPAMIGGF